MLNAEAIKLAVKAIEANPDTWNQTFWIGKRYVINGDEFIAGAERANATGRVSILSAGTFVSVEECQTTFCLAGQAMLQAGLVDEQGRYVQEDGTTLNYADHNITDMAGDLLGLDRSQAESIFFYGTEADPYKEGKNPTVAGLKRRITDVTGITFED
jgi:hypothetical protein